MTHFLIARGVSALDKAFDSSTAADLARRHGHDEIEVFLERQEKLESQHPKPVDNAQTRDPSYNLRINGMLVLAKYLINEANIFIVVEADGLDKRDIHRKCRELQPFLRISAHT